MFVSVENAAGGPISKCAHGRGRNDGWMGDVQNNGLRGWIMRDRGIGGWSGRLVLLLALTVWCSGGMAATAAERTDKEVASNLANLLRAARGVVSANQDLINDPAVADKGLTGEVVLAEALQRYRKSTGEDLSQIDPDSRYGRAMSALQKAIVQVTDEHQSTINMPNVGFKGFIPAVFARLVNERFGALMQGEAEMKVTAPKELVRNRKARPDAWEAQIIETKLSTPEWPRGEPFMASSTNQGREAFRFLIPEYYQASCLSCHGQPKGELDVTGYPKEGGEEGALGAVISVTLYH
jgi:hypothetical protein